MKGLIVTADDFGLSTAVNEAVEIAHRDGILTAASLMVTGGAVRDAVERARTMPALAVGLHLVLVEGRPALPPEQVSLLVGADGRFRNDMVRAGITIFARPGARAQLEAEIDAQFAAFAATGLRLDHVNAHKHFHVHPTIAATLVRVGKRYGLKGVRAPVEDRAFLAGLEPGRSPRFDPASFWARRIAVRMRRAGLLVPDRVFGLAWSGAFDVERMRALSAALPDGLTEVYTHPATSDVFDDAAPGYAYRAELAALTDPKVVDNLAHSGTRRGGFAAFAGADR